MSSPLGVAIEVDTSRVLPELDRVKGGLRDTQTQMEKLKQSVAAGMKPAADAFGKVASAVEQERQALQRLDVIRDQQAAKNATLARGFAGVAQAIELERDMLNAIRGPAEQLAKDTELLSSMQQRGVITTKEYEAQLAKLKATATTGAAAGGSRGVSLLGAQFGLSGIGSAVGIAGGIAGGILAARELVSINDKYVELSNSAMRFTDASHNVDQVLIEQRELARDLHMDLGQSMEGYEKVREAAEDLNLSTQDTIRLDKSYTEAAVLNGRATEDLAQQMQNVNVAMQTGTDVSRPLRAIFKEFPEIAKQWEGALGLTERQIFQMAKSGKLSFGDLERATITATDALDKKFAARVKTTKQSWDEFVDDVERPIPDLGTLFDETKWTNLDSAQKKAIENAERQAHALVVTVNGIKSVTDLTQDVLDTLDKYDRSLTRIESHFKSGEYATGLAKGLAMIVDKTKDIGEAGFKMIGGDDPWDPHKLEDKMKAIKSYHHELTDEEKLLQKIQAPMKEANELIRDSASLYGKGAISVQQWGEQVRKAQEIAGTTPIQSVVTGDGGDFFTPFRHSGGVGFPAANLNEFDANKTGDVLNRQLTDGAYQQVQLEEAERQLAELDKKATTTGEHVGETWQRAVGQINKSIVDLVTTGKINFDDLGSTIERILAEIALAQIESGIAGAFRHGGGGSGGTNDLGNALGLVSMFAYGGDVSVGSGGLSRLPHAAYGSNYTVGGNGGIDSKLAMLMVSPGETISVRNQQQQEELGRKGGQGTHGGAGTVNHFNMLYDRRAIISNRDDDGRVLEALRRNRSAARALVGRR